MGEILLLPQQKERANHLLSEGEYVPFKWMYFKNYLVPSGNFASQPLYSIGWIGGKDCKIAQLHYLFAYLCEF